MARFVALVARSKLTKGLPPARALLIVAILSFASMLWMDREWPLRPFFNFQKANLEGKSWNAWDFSIYTPFKQTLTLSGKLLPSQGGKLDLQALSQDGKIHSSLPLQAAPDGVAPFSLHLPVEEGQTQITLKVVSLTDLGARSSPVSFRIQKARLSHPIWNARKGLFFIALIVVIAASVAGGKYLGMSGLELWCFCPIPAFLGVTGTASLLSIGNHLNGITWPGSLIVISAGVLGFLWSKRRPCDPTDDRVEALGWPELFTILILSVPFFVSQMTTPVSKGDDQMYHAPRAGYWLSNSSIWPFPAHNERLTAFAAGGDMLFAWGTMTALTEQVGKFVVFLAYPLTLLAMLGLMRSLKIHRGLAWAAMVGLGTTPILLSATQYIKPDLWLVLFTIIALHWTLRAVAGRALPSPLYCGLASAAVALAIAVKWTAIPLAILLPCVIWRSPHWWGRIKVVTASFCIAMALDSAGPLMLINTLAHGHPFGSEEMRATHHPDPGWHSLVVQCKRLPFLLAGVPFFPTVESQQWVEKHLQQAAVKIGASVHLGYEGLWAWPGVFTPNYPMVDKRFSLTWLFTLAGAGATIGAFQQLKKRGEVFPFAITVSLGVLLTIAIVTQVRWQAVAELPERFLTYVLPLLWLALAWTVDRLPAQKWALYVLGGVGLALHSVPFFVQAHHALTTAAQKEWLVPVKPTSSQLTGAASQINPGSTILLFAEENTLDYQLFHPREGFPSRVRPWGRKAFEPRAFEAAIDTEEIDAVVFTSDDRLLFSWTTSIDAQPFIRALERRTDFRQIKTKPPIVIFLRTPEVPLQP